MWPWLLLTSKNCLMPSIHLSGFECLHRRVPHPVRLLLSPSGLHFLSHPTPSLLLVNLHSKTEFSPNAHILSVDKTYWFCLLAFKFSHLSAPASGIWSLLPSPGPLLSSASFSDFTCPLLRETPWGPGSCLPLFPHLLQSPCSHSRYQL